MSQVPFVELGIALLILVVGSGIWIFYGFQRLKASEAWYRTASKRAHLAQSIAGLGYIEWYYESETTLVSQYVRDFLRLHPTEPLTVTDLTARLHPDDAGRVSQALKATRDGSAYDIEHRFDLPEVGTVWVHALGTPLRDPQNNVVGLLGVFLDITNRKRMEERQARMQIELNRARRYELVETLAGRIAHDFNNVLQSILGNLDLEIDTLGGVDSTSVDLIAARKATLEAMNLVSKLELLTQDPVSPVAPVNPAEIILSVIADHEGIDSDTIDVTLELPEGCSPVLMDGDSLRTVINHLFENAIQALDGTDGNISINLKELVIDPKLNRLYPEIAKSRCAMISITDNGRGIAEKDLARIFDPLFSTKESGAGVGLGLAIVRSVVEGNGGGIRIQSVDGITSVVVVLPIAQVES
jgi:signal transduction histidine kinase